jgi:hypothetical protein
MLHLNRPIAQTIAMMVDFTVLSPEYHGTDIHVVPDALQGRPVSIFTAPTASPNKSVVIYEPTFDETVYDGINVSFIKNHASLLDDNFRGPDVANIARQLVEFLAHSA